MDYSDNITYSFLCFETEYEYDNDKYLNDIYIHLVLEYDYYEGRNYVKHMPSFTRNKLNGIAFFYDLHPENYKNKRELTRAILDVFETKFKEEPEYKKKYEEYHGFRKKEDIENL